MDEQILNAFVVNFQHGDEDLVPHIVFVTRSGSVNTLIHLLTHHRNNSDILAVTND